MAERLTEITTHYHTFVDNQVLTDDQLNQFIGYFEDQDRLSRVFLSGVGIVCGFNLGVNPAGNKITITQGVGVTTDGDLIQLRKPVDGKPFKSIDLAKLEYSHFKKFEDNVVDYSFFKKTVSGEEQLMDLQEVFTDPVENSKPLSELSGWKNKVVLLYLESFPKEGDLCTTTNCDNQGVEQVFRLRVLLVSKEDAEIIAAKDSVFSKHNIADDYFDLPEIAVRRVVMNEAGASGYDEMKRVFQKVLSDNQLRTNLETGIKTLVNDFGQLLQLENMNLNAVLNRLKNIMVSPAYNVPFNVQYRYDCIKDIADTWNEIKALLLDLKEECCPDINAFPKHLLLGNINEINSDVKHNRHGFYKSPVISNRSEKINECKNLVGRMFEIIEKFQTKPGDVKITPSNKTLALSFRAVPFYYAVDDELLKSWNSEKTERNEPDRNLSYHTDKLSTAASVQEPLAYSIDKNDFFRIEGHQGKDYRKALQQIDQLKRKYGLAFDVKALSVNINTENLNIDDYECEFEDLQVMLRAWTADQECILAEISKFLSGLSLKEPGKNVKESEFDATHFTGVESAARFFENFSGNEFTGNIAEGTEFSNASYYQPYSYYKKNTAVTENLTTEEDALGNAMKSAFDETKGGSVNDTIAIAKSKVESQIDLEAWNENPEMKSLLIDNSVELMAYANKLTEIMPDKIGIIDVTRVDDYKLTLNELCKLVKKLRTRYESIDLDADMKSFTQLLITQLSSVCCSGKKLEILQEEINKRKESILLRLQLSKFVEKHPGIEHMAGVPNGGTFVLVYLNKVQRPQKESTSPVREIIGNRNILEEMGANVNVFPAREIRSGQPIVSNEMLTHGITDFQNINEEELRKRFKLLEKFIGETDLPNNTVVADFALPYMCCSDCAPVNFIVPKPPVFLRLETDKFCLGKDESPLIFEVSPEDGVIKADPEVAGLSIDGNKLSIDASAFPEAMLGKPIGFTVNDQVTDVKFTIHKGVEFDFAVPQSPTTETEITFTPTGNLEGASFLWSFGDDNMSTDRNPTHRYSLPVNDENKVTVSLTVTAANGVCSSTVEHEITFEEIQEEVRIALEKKDYCENDEQQYPFRIFPDGADATVEGPGVQPGSNAFVPANAGTGEHSFKVNGNPSGITVTVHEAPVAKITPQQVNNQLVVTNESTGANSFIWEINGETIERTDNSQIVRELTPNSPTTNWSIRLTAVSEFCGRDATGTEFTTEFVADEPTCVEDTKTAIRKDLRALLNSNIPTSNFVVPIWKSTSELYGGTTDFNQGVLDDADNFLNGQNNEKLPEMFMELLQQTARMIVELRDQSQEEAGVLLQLFALQLRLFYNILRCQSQEVINASANNIKQVLDMILDLLLFLKSRDVIIPVNLIQFLNVVWEKLKEIPLLNEHFSKMKEQGII